MIMEPGPEDIRNRLWQVASSSLVPVVGVVSDHLEIQLLMSGRVDGGSIKVV